MDDIRPAPRQDQRSTPAPDAGPCLACGSPQAQTFRAPDGPARLCPPCATLHGLGCP